MRAGGRRRRAPGPVRAGARLPRLGPRALGGCERLAIAVQRAYEGIRPQQGPEGVRALIGLLSDVPALRARWLSDLRTIEDALLPVVQRRARRPVSDEQARITAAAIVTALRIAVETLARSPANDPPIDVLARALKYLREGANL